MSLKKIAVLGWHSKTKSKWTGIANLMATNCIADPNLKFSYYIDYLTEIFLLISVINYTVDLNYIDHSFEDNHICDYNFQILHFDK